MNHPHTEQPIHHKKKKKYSFKKIVKWAFLGGLCAVAAGTLLLAVLSFTLPDPAQLNDRQVKQSTKIYDRTGKILLYEIFNAQKRTVIDIKDLPPYVIDATVAIEDKNFYHHNGIAWKSLARAIYSNLTGSNTGQGGASTLTQQFVKKAIVGDERSIFRKVKEALLAIKVERNYTKEEILGLYFNEIPYGSTNYGVESAAQNYFGRPAKEISLSQAATLAALIQAPTRYLNNIPRLTSRRDYVLQVMAEQNYISKEEAEHAEKEPIVINPQSAGTVAPHFIMMVKEQLTDVFGTRTVDEGGLTVITTLDVEKQKIAQEEVEKAVEFNRKNYNAQNAALVALEAKTGDIIAMVGSRNFFDKEYDGQVNVALSPRQPGSSFKPLVYLLGFEKGYTPETILYDVKTAFKTDGADYAPNNYDLKERGPITLRKALQGSLNIPAVKMLYLVGVDTVLNRAHDLGYTTLTDRSRFGLSLVLGGGEVTLLEHSSVFATFARGGEYLPTQSILEVKDAKGESIFKKPEIEVKRVIESDAVATLSNVLSDNASRAYVFGERSPLQLGSRPVAAKTGTTNDYRDGWVMGYTPSLAVGVWAGNNDNTSMNRAGGSLAGGSLWNGFMTRALKDTPIEQFPTLPKPKTDKGILLGQDPSMVEVEIDTVSGKLATEFTPPETRLKKRFFVGHSILYFINREDPLGEPPQNPGKDPQFAPWEGAIRDWATRNNMIIEDAPTEFDDVHTAAGAPQVSFNVPTSFATVARTFEARVFAYSSRTITRVDYMINDEVVGRGTSAPDFSATVNVNGFDEGQYELVAVVYDDVKNSGRASVPITISGEGNPPSATWTSQGGLSVTSIDFPLELTARITRAGQIRRMRLLEQTPTSEREVTANIEPTTNFTFRLDAPSKPGTYIYYLELELKNGATITSDMLTLVHS